MKSNPGGQIPPSDVIGRDKLIRSLWHILERQSLVLCAERRLGKTCVVKKMVEEAPQDTLLAVYHDLEGVRTPLEFVEIVFDDVKCYLSRSNRIMKRTLQLLSQISGTEIGGVVKLPDVVASHWKALLTRIIEDLAEHQDRTVIFFWDEMPLMLYNIKQRSDEDTAMELLDTLRSLRQMNPRLRMVFTGSIGLHNVITSLKRSGYANDPTNDMYMEDVPPLSLGDAQELAHRLLKGEIIPTDNPQATARAIAEAVDNNPFYIHHIVSEMRDRDVLGDEVIVREIVDTCLTDSHDRWHMRYYRERIDTYYSRDKAQDERAFALNLLDILSASNQPLTFNSLFNLLKSRMVTEDREMALSVLTMLQRDHYTILQSDDGAYRFRFPLIQRWWRIHRGVA